MPTPQELVDAITSDMRRVQDAMGLSPSEANATRLSDALDRLETGIEAGMVAVQTEPDAGRLATTQYRLLDTAVNSAVMLRDRAEVVLTGMASAGVRTPGDISNPNTRRRVARGWSIGPLGIVTAASVVVVGAAWFFSRKRTEA